MSRAKPMADELARLAVEVERATEGSRDLDARIALAVDPGVDGWVRHPNHREVPDGLKGELWPTLEGFRDWLHHNADVSSRHASPYSTSLDAVEALIRETLPGFGYEISDLPPQRPWGAIIKGGVQVAGEHAATSPLALLAATLRALALASQEKADADA